ncbi:MAG TPA: PQQ-binding-like beta-propeller repeat protein, partial [Gemmataceae bacterium]|nr:PQQ-binding-like beta-propeller repeat protein [Gemmataceae bacterium]
MLTRNAAALGCLGLIGLLAGPVRAADWPMWRHDAGRTAASPAALAATLHLQWVREYPPLKPAWPDQAKMQLDAVYEPVVLGKTMFVGSSRTDSVTALDTETGAEKWRYHVDGPVRFPPVAWEGKVYFVSDDGYLYCLDASRGTLLWKFRGGPSDRKVLGNERLISAWPARGAPVIADGVVYFAASIWPFMGIFIHALDARTGEVVWTNDGDGAIYIKQPHNADSFAGVAPQGPLVVVGDYLLIPGGRSVPALYDRRTGKLVRYQLAENGKRGGGSRVSAIGNVFINGGAAFELINEKYLAPFAEPVVLTEEVIYNVSGGACRAYDLKNATIQMVETKDRRGEPVKVAKWTIAELGSVALPKFAVETMIKAGPRLYIGAPGMVLAIDLPLKKDEAAVSWRAAIDGTPASLLAADDRLFVVTREGRIYCFGGERVQPRTHALMPAPPSPPTP